MADKPPSLEELKALRDMLKNSAELGKYSKLYVFQPNPKQKQFFDLGAHFRERMISAGNQQGKTMGGAYETGCHLTGLYPPWWQGRRYSKAPRGWAAGPGAILVRDGMQKWLCGSYEDGEAYGTGMIPKELFASKPVAGHGAGGAFDTIRVKHVSGDTASLTFKSYEQGREKFQAEAVDFIWLDEEAPEDIYSECLARISATDGMIYTTFTPLKGFTALVRRFWREKPPGTALVTMGIEDATHLTPEMRERIIAGYPLHERDARVKGLPYLGSNAVFEEVSADQLRVPLVLEHGRVFRTDLAGRQEVDIRHWTKLWGIDFGIAHAFAAALLGWDRDLDRIVVLAGLKIVGGIPRDHAARMLAIASDVPVAWPHDGNDRDKGSGEPLAKIYKREGLKMLLSHATLPTGGYSTEAGVMEMLVRMRSERFFVAEGCEEWFEEFRSYYRDKGLIVKKNDDLMSATRIGVIQIRSSRPGPLGFDPRLLAASRRQGATMARDVDYDLFDR